MEPLKLFRRSNIHKGHALPGQPPSLHLLGPYENELQRPNLSRYLTHSNHPNPSTTYSCYNCNTYRDAFF